MSEVSKSLIVTFDALNLVKGIKSIGGPDKQVYYIESDVFAPDRRITPLILQPYLIVEDPHRIIPNGDKISELSSAKWYFDEIKSENRITAKEEDASLDTPFALGVNNSLHIRKNVEKAIQLFFEAEYLDIRKNKNIYISLTYLLTTTQSSEVKPAPKLKLSKPQSWRYNPLNKINKATIEAEVFADNKGYKSAVEWCKVENNKEIPLTDEPFVLGGQNSNKLVVNPHVMGDTLLRARNLSEEIYNKYYGVNPEWDDRIHEVMENRNLIILARCKSGLIGLNGSISSNRRHLVTDYYIDVEDKIVSLSRGVSSENDGGFWRYAYYDSNKNYISRDAIRDELLTLNFSNKVKYMKVSFPADQWAKLEQGDKATPYTPAPEDLNYQNLVVNSSNFKNTNSWKLVGNSSNLKIDGDYLGFDIITNAGGWKGVATHNYISVNKGDLCYVKYIVNSQKALTFENSDILDVTLMDKRGASGDGLYVTFSYKVLEPNKDTFISNVILANESATNAYLRIRHASNEAVNFKIKDVTLINLTAKFGAGNEPSKEFCDEIFKQCGYIPSPYDLAPNGIIKGSYQSDIKFTKYFPEINAEILFLTGDSIRPEHKTIKAQALFTTNKEPIDKPSEFFDIEWFIDSIEAGGVPKRIGTGEFMEIAVSELPLKGGRLVPIRLKYNFK